MVAKAALPKIRTFRGSLLATRPLEIVAIDFTILERASSGHENVLIVTDVFSKFTQAYPTLDQKAKSVVKVITEKWFYTYGPNDSIQTKVGVLKENFCTSYAHSMGSKKVELPLTTLKEMGSASVLTAHYMTS